MLFFGNDSEWKSRKDDDVLSNAEETKVHMYINQLSWFSTPLAIIKHHGLLNAAKIFTHGDDDNLQNEPAMER